MKSSLEKNKTIIIALIVFTLVISGYNYFLKDASAGDTADQSAQDVGNDLVDLYQSVNKATLDQSLFSTASYRALVDWSPVVPAQPTGRQNPFAPIGQ